MSLSLTLLAPSARAAGPYDLERSNEPGWLGGGLALALGGARLSFFSAHSSFSAMNCFFTATVFSDYSSDRNAEAVVWSGAVLWSVLTGACRRRDDWIPRPRVAPKR